MAVLVNFEAETVNDVFSPMTIASALAENDTLDIDDLDEIADHLKTYVKNVRKEINYGEN